MSSFKKGEKVRIIESGKEPSVTYTIKDIKKSGKITLYLLKSEEDPVLRLYYEDEKSLLERVV